MACRVDLPEFVSHGHTSTEILAGLWWQPTVHVCVWTTNSEGDRKKDACKCFLRRWLSWKPFINYEIKCLAKIGSWFWGLCHNCYLLKCFIWGGVSCSYLAYAFSSSGTQNSFSPLECTDSNFLLSVGRWSSMTTSTHLPNLQNWHRKDKWEKMRKSPDDQNIVKALF